MLQETGIGTSMKTETLIVNLMYLQKIFSSSIAALLNVSICSDREKLCFSAQVDLFQNKVDKPACLYAFLWCPGYFI